MCGIVGISAETNVAAEIYDSLLMLQHRGQDAAGISVCNNDDQLNSRKSMGYVRDVFQQRHMDKLVGNYGIGHVRYPTAGGAGKEFAQPMYVNSPYGISLAHNGNLTNSKQLGTQLFHAEMRHLRTDSDSEVLLNIFAHELGKQREIYPSEKNIFKAVTKTHIRCDGAYAVIALITGYGLVAFRDNNGIRPLSIGVRQGKEREEYIVSSEDALFTPLGFEKLRDIDPGEAVFIDKNGKLFSQQCADNPQKRPCIFEYVYFSRPDSKIDEISVYKARMRMGTKLAGQIKRIRPDHDIDVVIPIPDSSVTAAHQLAVDLNVPYREGFVKNRYIGRTFIMPGQKIRKDSVRKKLNTIEAEFAGKTVLIVDDSVVRGNTSRRIVRMARDAGASKVLFASSSPPIIHPNVYGIDMPAREEYVAFDKTVEQISETIGADWMIYQDLGDMVEACLGAGEDKVANFDCSCFDGVYVTGTVSEEYLQRLGDSRSDSSKEKASV